MTRRKKIHKTEKKLSFVIKLAMAVMFLSGVAVFSYPFYVDSLNNFLDQRRIQQFQQEMQDKKQEEKEHHLEQMRQQNDALQTGTVIPGMGMVEDPFDEAVGQPTEPDRSYYEERTIGAIYIPTIKVSLPLFDETNNHLLEKGATLLQGTSFPIGGKDSHSVITGHSGIPEKKIFTDLEKLNEGDHFFIEIMGEKLAYEITAFKTVLPTELDDLTVQKGRDLVTLLTCTPYAVNTHRLLVTGQRVPYIEEEMAKGIQEIQSYHNQRLLWLTIGGIAFLGLFFYWLWRKRQKFKQQRLTKYGKGG